MRLIGGGGDTEPPVISNAAITNVTNTGYTVTCTVTDNTGVSKVEFPTWKVSDTSVGCTWYRGTQHGSTYTFTFQGADRDGNYLTHIYAFDSAGNIWKAMLVLFMNQDQVIRIQKSHFFPLFLFPTLPRTLQIGNMNR